MFDQPFSIPITELASSQTGWKMRIIPQDSLRYCPASAGDWGIIRAGLLVPESAMLFVAPNGCGRHGAIAGIQNGFKDNLFFLCISEPDIVSGAHMEKIPLAVKEILAESNGKFKAVQICATCIDTLLASDYDGLAEDLEAETGIPMSVCHMNPITMDGKAPPPFTVQKAIYNFLKPTESKQASVNIIGSYAGIMEESEFHQVMKLAGFDEVMHVASCSSFRDFLQMASSACNVLIKPAGRLAIADMKKRLGIPSLSIPLSYGVDAITAGYRELETILGKIPVIGDYREQALEKVNNSRQSFSGLRVAVGQSINAGTFELARALTEIGLDVRYIFSDMIIDTDREHVFWLKEHVPGITVYTNAHTSMVNFLEQGLTVDLAIGFDSAYYCSCSKVVPLDLGIQPYGFQATHYLLDEIAKALLDEMPLKEKMYASGLVI